MRERERKIALGPDGLPSHLYEKRLADHFDVSFDDTLDLWEDECRYAQLVWTQEKELADQMKTRKPST